MTIETGQRPPTRQRRVLPTAAILLIVLYLAAVTLPLILSWVLGGEPRPLRSELASGLGILAFSMILVEFVLSGRFRKISNRIGMDITMRFHQVMARTALAFAMLHPFLYEYTPAGGPRPWDPTRQLIVTTEFSALATGIAAFVLLPALVLIAIGRSTLDFSYEAWRLLHGVGALLIAGLLLHHATTAGRYGSQPEMVWVWLAMTAIAAGTLLYVYVLAPMRQRGRPWQVASVTRLTPRQWELIATPEGHDGLDYKAGQFVWLNVGHSTFSLRENPFSLSSAPACGPAVSFMIKELGDFTGTIGQIAPGTRAWLDGPFGHLTVEGRSEPGIGLIAGGVGLAPLLGILRQMRATGDSRAVRLVYGNRTAEQIAFAEEMRGEDVVHVVSEPSDDWQGETGWIDGAMMDRVFRPEEMAEWVFVLCGPAAMMDLVEDHLIARGTPSHRILSERFDYD